VIHTNLYVELQEGNIKLAGLIIHSITRQDKTRATQRVWHVGNEV
jgi:hypothetical protein